MHIFQDRDFSLSGPATSDSPIASICHDPETLSSVLLASFVSSPCPDANGEIDPLVIGSSNWLILWLPRTNQMWEGE